jgi:hypothetical protein
MRVWIFKHLTAEAGQRKPQTTQQGTKSRWLPSGQSIQDATQEGKQEDKQGHREMV